jgi:tmRNA-binding protein
VLGVNIRDISKIIVRVNKSKQVGRLADKRERDRERERERERERTLTLDNLLPP